MGPGFLGYFAEPGYLVNLDEFIKKYADKIDIGDIFPRFGEATCVYNGSWYALPVDGDVMGLLYRTDLFGNTQYQADFKAEYGRDLTVPDTWDEFIEVLEFFDGKEPNLKGTTIVAAKSHVAITVWRSVYASLGGEFYDDARRKVLIEKDLFVETEGIFEEILMHAPKDNVNGLWVEQFAALVEGRAATSLQWFSPLFADPAQNPKFWDKLGYAEWPGTRQPDGSILRTPPFTGNQITTINAASKNQLEAFALCGWYSTINAAMTATGTGQDINRMSAAEDPRVKEAWGEQLEPYLQGLSSMTGQPDMKTSLSVKLTDDWASVMHPIWSGDLPSSRKVREEAYDKIVEKWNATAREAE
jgi:multiple sugar transport system substrate-binding protein